MNRPIISQDTPNNQIQSVGTIEQTVGSSPTPGTPSGTSLSGVQGLLRAVTSNPKALAGLSILGFFLLVAIFGPFFLHSDPNAFSNDALVPPSAAHWLGTTQTGQDVFTQVVDGTRASILWGLTSGLIATFLSILIGLASGYLVGIAGDLLGLLINVFLVLPGLPLIVLLVAYLPFKGPLTVALVLGFTNWPYQARVLRAQTLSFKQRDFVDAARASGESTWRILFREVLPNEIAIVAAGFIGTLIFVIGAAASLEFLGLSNVTSVDWGTMLFWAQNNNALLQGAWWWFVAPGLALAVLGAGLVLLNFSIDEVADPRLRHELSLKRRVSRWYSLPFRKVQRAQ